MPCRNCIGALVSAQVSRQRLNVKETWAGIREQRPIILHPRRLGRFLTPKAYALGCLASLAAAVLIVAVMIAVAEYTKTRGRLLLTALVLAIYFFTSMGPVWLAQRRAATPTVIIISRVGLGAGAAALLLLLTGIWGTPNSDAFWKSSAIVTLLGLLLAYLAVVELRQGRLTRRFAVKTVALAVFIACLGIAVGIKWPPYWWVFTLAVIVWAAALLTPAVFYLGRRIQGR